MRRTHRHAVVKIALVLTMSAFVPVVARGSDESIKTDVQNSLKADRSLDDSRIRVAFVKDGTVLLSGGAASLDDIVRALRLTADRPGVRRVFSEIGALEPVAPVDQPLIGTWRVVTSNLGAR